MLGFRRRPRWRTIAGGSRIYVQALTRPWRERLRLSTPVTEIRRHPDHVAVSSRGHEPERFDAVVMATHSYQALALLVDPSERERELLGAIPYQRNEAVLHTDRSLLPRRRRAWASWNYHLDAGVAGRCTVTYHMNRLQSLRADREFCVTLNRTAAIDPEKIIRTMQYAHPSIPLRGLLHRLATTRSAPAIARTTAAPTGDGASTRTASRARCGWCASSVYRERNR